MRRLATRTRSDHMNGIARLKGTGRIADDLYLLAHDDVTGKPFLQPRALGLGLAGALLAELLFAEVIRVNVERIEVTRQGEPADGLGHHILGVLRAEPEWHPLRDWLTFIAGTAVQDVGRRLERAGYLSQVRSRRPWRGTKRVPADSDAAFAPLIRVRAVLYLTEAATVSDAVLTGLATACGLASRVLLYGQPDARDNVDIAIRRLHPSLRELIAQTQAAVDSALLSHRV